MNNQHFHLYKGLKVLKSSHPDVRKIKRQQSGHSAHGNKVWRSSFVMLDYLETYPLEKGSSALEIGCGWGLASLYLNKIQDINVKGIDIDPSVKPYFELQNNINWDESRRLSQIYLQSHSCVSTMGKMAEGRGSAMPLLAGENE